MKLLPSVKLALSGLRASKKRAFLTMLDIIIGVGSVIVIISAGAGAQGLIVNELSSFGSDIFGILPGAANDNGPPASAMGITVTTLTLKDIEKIREIPHVTAITAYVRGVDTITYQNQKTEGTFLGVSSEFLEVEPGEIIQGRFFNTDENKSLAKVVILGSAIKNNLFGDSNPLGENIKIKNQNFKIIGVREEIGTIAFENKDKQLYVPIKTAQKLLLGINHISLARGKFDSPDNLNFVLEEVRQSLRESHNITQSYNDDFSVRSIDQALSVINSITDAIKFFLAGIAAISLLVGGIGIMNIMLMNISERTKEIGLRKALGATSKNILKQFLVESMTLTLLGGIIGTLLGILFSWFIALGAQVAGFDWNFIVSSLSIFMALGISVLVGLIFGSFPAMSAAKLEPVEALRKK